MKNQLITILSLLILSCAILSCSQKEESELILLTFSEKALCPYKVNQSISFKNSNGSDFDLKVETDVISYQTDEFCSMSSSEHLYETKKISLKSIVPEFYIDITIPPSSYKENITIMINNYLFDFLYSYMIPMDSVIDDIEFSDIYVVGRSSSDKHTIQPDTIIYSVSEGLIQIKMNNDDTYTLKK